MNGTTTRLSKAPRVRLSRFHAMLLFLLLVYAAIAAWFGILKFEFMQSDVLSYWHNTIDWRTPFDLHHVPGYPLAVALARGLTFGLVPPIPLMMGVNLASFIGCAILIYRIIQFSQVGEGYALAGAALFSLFPFVGVVNAVFPIADLPSLVLFLAGLYALLRSHLWRSAAFMGLALFTHKGIWIFVAMVILAYLLHTRLSAEPLSYPRLVIAGLLLAAPLLILWVLGSFYHGTPTWILTTDLGQVEPGTKRLPLFDGLIGTLRLGGLRALVKGTALYAVFLGAGVLLWASLRFRLRFRPPFYAYGAAISMAVFISALIINTPIAWAVVRYGRLLVLPFIWTAGSIWGEKGLPWNLSSRSAVSLGVAGMLLMIASQFMFAWYMAAIYYE